MADGFKNSASTLECERGPMRKRTLRKLSGEEDEEPLPAASLHSKENTY